MLGATTWARMVDFVLISGATPILFDRPREWSLSWRFPFLMTALLIANPVVLYQSLSLYAGGDGYLLMAIALIGLVALRALGPEHDFAGIVSGAILLVKRGASPQCPSGGCRAEPTRLS